MKVASCCLLLFLVLHLAHCEWIACASDGGTCDASPNYVIARYGGEDSWNYRFVMSGTFPCSSSFFGSPVGTSGNSCYFLIDNDVAFFFVYVVTENQNFIVSVNSTVPENTYYAADLYFGDPVDKAFYQLTGLGYFSCSSGQFGAEPYSSGTARNCYVSLLSKPYPGIECAFDSQPCTVPDASAIYPVIYTGYSTDNYDTTEVKYASSVGPFSCSKSALFPGTYPPQNSENKCFYDSTNMIQFADPIGEWKQVESCEGNITCSYSLCYGVTSTTSQATSSSWSMSLSDTVKEGIGFESESMTTEVSTSVSNTISSAYTQTATKSCSASCDIGPNGQAFLWQWQMVTQEVNYANADNVMVPFTTFACNYICTNTTAAPQCPPGYCADSACQTCTTDIFNNVAEKEKKEEDVLDEIFQKYRSGNAVYLVPEGVEPELRQKLIEQGHIPLESLNLPRSILDRIPTIKRVP